MILSRLKVPFVVLISVFINQGALGQVIFPGTAKMDYYDLLLLKNPKLNDPILLAPAIISEYGINDSTLTWDIWGIRNEFDSQEKNVFLINPNINLVYNSKYPRVENDGAAWAGKGITSSINFGIGGKIGILRYTLAPSVNFSQNRAYDIPVSTFNKSEFSYPFEGNIDWVQRFGNDSYYNFNLGQSEIRIVYKNATIGVSNQNMKWGPAKYYPIIMSNNAAGIPHLDIGTKAPIKSKIGDIEFKTFWGILTGSDYFDNANENNKSYFTGAIFGYQPKYIRGLSIGVNRVLYRDLSLRSFNFKDAAKAIGGFGGDDKGLVNGQITPNDLFDQMISAMLKWTFSEVGFEAYIEFAKNDFNGDLRDKLSEPDHSRAHILGFVKIIDFSDGNLLKINYEHANISTSRTTLLRPTPSFYVHSVNVNGYTQRGQLIGAAIGPGSNADVMEISYVFKSGLIGIKGQRIRFNDDYFFEHVLDLARHDTEYSLALNYVRLYPKFRMSIGLMNNQRINWNYVLQNDVSNWQATFNISYNLNIK